MKDIIAVLWHRFIYMHRMLGKSRVGVIILCIPRFWWLGFYNVDATIIPDLPDATRYDLETVRKKELDYITQAESPADFVSRYLFVVEAREAANGTVRKANEAIVGLSQ